MLSHGDFSSGNSTINDVFGFATAISIESSGGITLVQGLRSLKEKDEVNAWLYIVLSVLLAIVGGHHVLPATFGA